MASLEHCNIVKLYRTFEGKFLMYVEGDWYFLVLEYCDMGDLHSIQGKMASKVFSIDEALNIFSQILKGV